MRCFWYSLVRVRDWEKYSDFENKNVVVGEHLNRSQVYLNVQVASVFESNFINLFQKLWLVNNENIKTNLNGLGQLLVLKNLRIKIFS